jgi:steroid delta-isomerase-like uncharacterized protein
MSVESTREVMTRYLNEVKSEKQNISVLAEDVVYTDMATGQEYHGPDEIRAMLNYFYRTVFEGKPILHTAIFGDNNAVFEGELTGKHIGEFEGISPTGKEVRIPMCIVYDLEDDQIKRGRIFFDRSVFLRQVGVNPAAGKGTVQE